MIDNALDEVRNKSRSIEKEIKVNITRSILDRMSKSISDKFFYHATIFQFIDNLVLELEELIMKQTLIKPSLESTHKEVEKSILEANQERGMASKLTIDCRFPRFSETIRLVINRLVTKTNQSTGQVMFDAINFDDCLRDSIRKTLSTGRFHPDKHLFIFANDHKKFPNDFFKVLLVEFNSNMEIKPTYIVYFDKNCSDNLKNDITFREYLLEDLSNSEFKLDRNYSNNIQVSYEDQVNVYDIQTKIQLAIYQIIFKTFILNKLSSEYYRKQDNSIPEVIITPENLIDFVQFIRTSGGYNIMVNRDLKGVNANLVNSYISPHMSYIPKTGPYLGTDTNEKYHVHQSMLDIYGPGTSNYKTVGGSTFDTAAYRSNYRSPDPVRRNEDTPEMLKSKLQNLLDNAQKKLDRTAEQNLRMGLSNYAPHSQYPLTNSTIEDSTLQAEMEEKRKQREEEMRAERELRQKIEKENWEKRQREVEERKRQEEQNRREREDRERKEREEFMKRQQEDKEKRDREYRERLEKEERDRREREDQMRKERDELERRDREEREKRDMERQQREIAAKLEWEAKEAERKQKEIADRLRREAEDAERREKEKQNREIADRLRREAEEAERVEREKQNREIADRLRRQAEEAERADKERKEKEIADRLRREAEEAQRREVADRLQREAEQADRERREREDRERREREDRDRRDREDRERRDREEAQKREIAERLRREAEEAERNEQERKNKEIADRLRREAEEAERSEQEKKSREIADRLKRQAEEAEREEQSRKDREMADALRKRAEEAEREEQAKRERERREEADRFARQKEEQERIAKENADREIADRLKKQAEEADKEAQAQKQQNQKKDDDFDDFLDDFDDLEDFGNSHGKNSNSPQAVANINNLPQEQPNPTPELPVKKRQAADEEIEFDDDFDDILDDFDGPPNKGSKEASIESPPKKSPEPEPQFAGGIRGLKKKADEQKQNPSNSNIIVQDNIHNHPKVLLSDDLMLVDKYLAETMPMSPDLIQEFMGQLQVDNSAISMLFQEFISSGLLFFLDFEDTNGMIRVAAEALEGNGIVNEAEIKKIGEIIKKILEQTFEGPEYEDLKYYFAPFLLVEELQKEMVVQCILDVRNQQVLVISLNPELNEADLVSEKGVQLITNSLAKSIHFALNGNTNVEIRPENIKAVILTPELIEFLSESCEEPNFRYLMISYLMLFENATNRHDFEGFTKSLQIEAFEFENAFRFVSTFQSLSESMAVRNELMANPQMAEPLMQTVEQIMKAKGCVAQVNMAEGITPSEQIPGVISQDLEELFTAQEEGATKIFATLEYCPSEEKKLLFYICLQDEPNQSDIVLYLNSNSEPENTACIEVINKVLAQKKRDYGIYFEHARHQFASNNIDVFLYTWLVQVYTMDLPPFEALKILIYNEVPFIGELKGDNMMEEGADFLEDQEGMPSKEDIEEGGVANRKPKNQPYDDEFDFGDEFDDIPDQKDNLPSVAAAKKPAPGAQNSGSKPKESKINYEENDFDDDFDGIDDGANFDDLDDLDF